MIGSRSWRALMWRNFIYRRRNIIGSILEFALPLIFILFLVLIKFAVEDTEGFAQELVEADLPSNKDAWRFFSYSDYVTAMQAKRRCIEIDAIPFRSASGAVKDYSISGIHLKGWNWQVPFVNCDSNLCTEDGEDATPYCEYLALGLAPSSSSDTVGKEQVQAFRDYIYGRFPVLENKTALPYDFDFVHVFDSDAEIEDYVTHVDYKYPTDENPKIALAVVFDGTDDGYNYAYKIRINSTNHNSPEDPGHPGLPTTPPTDKEFEHYSKEDNSCALPEGAPDTGPYQDSCTAQYIYNGAISTQRLIHDFLFETTGSKDAGYYVSEHGVQFARFPSTEHVSEGFYAAISDWAPLFVTLGILYPVAAMARYIVLEKQTRQKEMMKMMGVQEADIGWSWYITFLMFHVFTAVGAGAMTKLLYSNSSLVILMIFWLFTFAALISLSFFLAAFFTQATRATLVVLLIFFGGYFLTLVVDFQHDPSSSIMAVSLHPAGAFAYGMQEIGRLEDLGVGLQMDTVTETDSASGFTFGHTLSILLVDSVLYGILGWYANRVVPSAFGRPLPLHFPFTMSYWFPRSIRAPPVDEDIPPNAAVHLEPVSTFLKDQAKEGKSIEIRNIRKSFREKIAVDGLSLSMYNGQITALLGHNGAGKTTTLNMLTGMTAPSAGHAVVAGKDIRTQMAEIRHDIGICLQHDCLFHNLTVKEHIQFFSMIKGVYAEATRKEAEEKITACIQDVALWEKRNTFSKNLSGGMKRKLSVAIAFCGDSKTVLLDEPTSGMDPFSRRFTWDVIRQYREGRCIILTTHFMDEADILGDRIAIMADGQLRCVGSSLFLKRTYGVGYNLTTELHGEGDSKADAGQKVEEIVTSEVSEATMLTNVGTEMNFQLPISGSSNFASMLTRLDEEVDKGTVVNYGLGITTLEEVFLLVAHGDENERTDLKASQRDLLKSSESFRLQGQIELEDKVFRRHVAALFRKRAANFKRDKKAWCCTTILPSLFVLTGFLLYTYAQRGRDIGQLDLTLGMFNPDVSSGPRNPIPINNDTVFQCQPGKCIYEIPFVTDNTTNESYTFCGYHAYLGPKSACSIEPYDNIINGVDDHGAEKVNAPGTNVSESSYSIAETASMFAASQFGGIYFTHSQNSSIVLDLLDLMVDVPDVDLDLGIDFEGFDLGELANMLSDNLTFGQAVDISCTLRKGDYVSANDCAYYGGLGYLIRYNFTALHAAPIFQAVADEAIIREALDDNNFRIKPIIHPLPLTKIEDGVAGGDDAGMAWFLIVLSFPFITGSFATFVVAERESKSKHLQTVAGVEPLAYWLSTWLWDVANYQIALWITVILMFAFDVEVFTTSERSILSGVIALLVLFGPAAASFTYCITFMFKSPSVCNLVVIIGNFIIGYAGAIGCFLLRMLGENPGDKRPNLVNAAIALEWVLRLIPSFSLSKGLFNIMYIEAFVFMAGEEITVWYRTVILYEVIFLSLQSILYLLLAVQLDKWSSSPQAVSLWRKFKYLFCFQWMCSSHTVNSEVNELEEDDDVIAEQKRVLEGGTDNDTIIIKELSKTYDNGTVAVKNLSLGIPPGQCFGLLGINGAGKTTTMGMLTAEFPPSGGDATLGGFSVMREPEKTRRRVGYCPQFDAHFFNMTGREHLELYASIKGVPAGLIPEIVANKLQEVGLSESDSNRLSVKYSGGMKRRLSLACATIGQPQLVFLDECSTGVDPVARREIWEMISNMVYNEELAPEDRPCVILTTHSMEECEALCPRIGIMAAGRLRCLGSAQQLKSKFGQGFQVELKVRDVDSKEEDYNSNLRAIAKAAGVRPPRIVDEGVEGVEDEESAVPESAPTVEVFLNLQQTLTALQGLTGDDYLASKLNPDEPAGFVIHKEASSVAGVNMSTLASFATTELRMKNLNSFIEDKYPESVMRERQDTKARYEVKSKGVKIAIIFADIEDNKEDLKVSEYSVSQTSLEQVFNMHAAEAARKLQASEQQM